MENILEPKERMLAEKNKAYKEMGETIQKTLEGWVKTLTGEEGVVSLPNIDTHCLWNKELWEVRCEVSYPCKDPEKIKKGWKTDFGADTTVYIYTSHIEINRGCIGTYGKDSKGQIFRDTFISEMWKVEKDIIDSIKDDINLNLIQEKDLLWREIEDLKHQTLMEKNRIEREALLKQIKEAKYLINLYQKYDHSTGTFVKAYGNIYRIDKITEKTIFRTQVNSEGREYWPHDQERYKLEMAISALKCNNMVASTEILQGDVPTQSE